MDVETFSVGGKARQKMAMPSRNSDARSFNDAMWKAGHKPLLVFAACPFGILMTLLITIALPPPEQLHLSCDQYQNLVKLL